MSIAAPRPATYEDLLAVPAHLVAEIVHGELRTHPRPRPRHLVASSALGAELGGPFQRGRGGPGGWWILDEPELHLGADVIVPDLGSMNLSAEVDPGQLEVVERGARARRVVAR